MKSVEPIVSVHEKIRQAMRDGDLFFFANREADDVILSIAIEEQNVLFARWCFIKGWKFEYVDPETCIPEFAQFMLEIIDDKDKRYNLLLVDCAQQQRHKESFA